MFFMIGITQGRKDLAHDQLVTCTQCGRYGRYQVFMTFTQLLLFFIPCFKWGKKYYVRMSCCGAVYELDPEIGERIARREDVPIGTADLTLVSGGTGRAGSGEEAGEGHAHMVKRCASCGYQTEEDFVYCPKCGAPLEK